MEENPNDLNFLARYKWYFIVAGLLILLQLGLTYFKKGNSPAEPASVSERVPETPLQAEIRMARQLALSQPSEATYLNLGRIYVNAGMGNEAVEVNLKALEFNPNSSVILNNLGASYNLCRRWDLAIEVLNKALLIQPGFGLAENNLKWARGEKEKMAHRFDSLEKVALASKSAQIWSDLGLEYYHVGFYDKAVTANREVLKINPSSALGWNNLCASLNNIGKWDEAIVACTKAAELDPNSTLTQNNLHIAKQNLEKQGTTKP